MGPGSCAPDGPDFSPLPCSSLSFLVKLEQLDLGGNDLEVLVREARGGRPTRLSFPGQPLAHWLCGPFSPEPRAVLFAPDPEWGWPAPASAGPSRAGLGGPGGRRSREGCLLMLCSSRSQPDTLGALPNLRELWLDRNQLSCLPPVSLSTPLLRLGLPVPWPGPRVPLAG